MQNNKDRIMMFLDLHGHTKGDGIFFYACQTELPAKPDHLDKAEANKILQQTVLVQTLPNLLSRNSQYFNQAQNKFFSFNSDKAGGKMNTARVVGAKELGIRLSYTIESSFYSYPLILDNGNHLKGMLNQEAMEKAGIDLLKGIQSVALTIQKI